MKRIALVRGHHLSKEETISYELLRDDFEFVSFSSDHPWFDHSEIVFPIVTLRSNERLFDFLPGKIANRIFGFLDVVLGAGQLMYGLKHALRGFDLVHVSDYNHLFALRAAELKKSMGYKIVAIHYENIPFARDRKLLVRNTKYRFYDQVDGLFAMSERARAALMLEGVHPEKIFVIGNAVDTEKFRPRPEENLLWRKQYGLSADDCVILFVGRIRASKGVFELIYAAKRLMSDPTVDAERVRVLIAGRGDGVNQANAMIRRLGLERHVRLIGVVPHAQIHLLHNMADIFTLPSLPRKYWQEQFGIVLIESMACGKPVVSTLSGSIPDVVGDSGFLVQPNDHYSLYLALRNLVRDPDLRLSYGQRSRARALSEFSTQVIARKLKAAYTTILDRP